MCVLRNEKLLFIYFYFFSMLSPQIYIFKFYITRYTSQLSYISLIMIRVSSTFSSNANQRLLKDPLDLLRQDPSSRDFQVKNKKDVFTWRREREKERVSGNGSDGSSSKETLTSGRNEFTFVEDDKLDLAPRARSIREVAWKFSPLGIPGFSLSITKITRDVHRETGPGIRVNVANAGRDGNFADPSRFQPRHAWKLPNTPVE